MSGSGVRFGLLELPVRWAVDGPWLAGEGETAPLASVVNGWSRRELARDLAALERGEEVDDDGHYARRPGRLDDLDAERERWRRLTGEEPDEDVYLVGLTYEPGELLVPRAALVAIAEQLAATGDRALDDQARQVDEATVTARDPEQAARAHVLRRNLLAALADAGVLSSRAGERRGTERLAGYAEAARQLGRYAASDARRALAARLDPDPAVSLDWFRLRSPAPPDADPFEWLARWEAIFAEGAPYAGGEGFSLVREDGTWYRLEWRRDDGVTPLLLRVEPIDGDTLAT